jgi:hypothetical protein
MQHRSLQAFTSSQGPVSTSDGGHLTAHSDTSFGFEAAPISPSADCLAVRCVWMAKWPRGMLSE